MTRRDGRCDQKKTGRESERGRRHGASRRGRCSQVTATDDGRQCLITSGLSAGISSVCSCVRAANTTTQLQTEQIPERSGDDCVRLCVKARALSPVSGCSPGALFPSFAHFLPCCSRGSRSVRMAEMIEAIHSFDSRCRGRALLPGFLRPIYLFLLLHRLILQTADPPLLLSTPHTSTTKATCRNHHVPPKDLCRFSPSLHRHNQTSLREVLGNNRPRSGLSTRFLQNRCH